MTKATRRNLLRSVGAGGLGVCEGGGALLADEAAAPQPMPALLTPAGIEPVAIKRRGVGFRGYDPARASPGFTLFAPSGDTNKVVYLVDIGGQVVHTWDMPYAPGLSGYLTDQGTLFYNGKIPDSTHIGQSPFKGGAALEMDWKGRVL